MTPRDEADLEAIATDRERRHDVTPVEYVQRIFIAGAVATAIKHGALFNGKRRMVKVTINLGYVNLGRINPLVQEGLFSNRTGVVRTAIRSG